MKIDLYISPQILDQYRLTLVVLLTCHSPELDGFDWHFQASQTPLLGDFLVRKTNCWFLASSTCEWKCSFLLKWLSWQQPFYTFSEFQSYEPSQPNAALLILGLMGLIRVHKSRFTTFSQFNLFQVLDSPTTEVDWNPPTSTHKHSIQKWWVILPLSLWWVSSIKYQHCKSRIENQVRCIKHWIASI